MTDMLSQSVRLYPLVRSLGLWVWVLTDSSKITGGEVKTLSFVSSVFSFPIGPVDRTYPQPTISQNYLEIILLQNPLEKSLDKIMKAYILEPIQKKKKPFFGRCHL